MSAANDQWHQVISLRVLDVDVKWVDGPICYVENRSLSSNVIAKARQVEEFVTSTGLLKKHKLRILFDSNGVAVEVITSCLNEDLFGFHEKLQIVKEQLHSKFISHRDSIRLSSNIASAGRPPESSPQNSKSDFAEKESIQKLLSGPTGAKIEIDFGSKKEIVTTQTSAQIHRQILDKDVKEILTGEIGIFNEIEQKVTFSNIDGVRGLITLDITQESDRRQLASALLDYRRVSVAFAPYRDSLRPDMQARTGKLISVESVGDANEKLI